MISIFSLHHTGGVQNDQFASTAHHTLKTIDDAHRFRWPDFPSKLRPDLVIGYTGVILRDGTLIQTRYIGEETAAIKGKNSISVSFCAIGNFNLKNGLPVDNITNEQMATIEKVVRAFVDGRPDRVGLQIYPGTVINIPLKNYGPHRTWWPTDCYGTAIPDSFLRNMIIAYLQSKLSILKQLLALYLKLTAPTNVPLGESSTGNCLDAAR